MQGRGGLGGLRIASANRCWSSTDNRMISVASMVWRAASWAADTTKSVRVRPWICAARLSSVWTSGGRRASIRAVVWAVCFIAPRYGYLPYLVVPFQRLPSQPLRWLRFGTGLPSHPHRRPSPYALSAARGPQSRHRLAVLPPVSLLRRSLSPSGAFRSPALEGVGARVQCAGDLDFGASA